MRILLFEDNQQIAQSLTDALEKQHYTVDRAADGKIGWRYNGRPLAEEV